MSRAAHHASGVVIVLLLLLASLDLATSGNTNETAELQHNELRELIGNAQLVCSVDQSSLSCSDPYME